MGRGHLLVAGTAAIALSVTGAAGAASAGVHGVAPRPAVAPRSHVIPGRLIVGFRKGVGEAAQGHSLRRAGADPSHPLGSSQVELAMVPATQSADAQDALAADPNVAYVEPDRTISVSAFTPPNDTQFKKQWGLNDTGQTVDGAAGTLGADIGALRAWPVTTGKKSVVVAVIDSGIALNHSDLAANIWINQGENCTGCRNDGIDNDHDGYVDDWRGWDFVNNDNNPTDDNGHGTHVAGTIGAIGNNGTGVAGVAWNVSLMPLKFVGADGTGDLANAVAAIRYATAMGAKISNNSWGDTEYSQALHDAIADADAHGDLFVAAAGNDGEDNDSAPHYPAGYDLPNVISVAASDSNDQLAYFSDFGRSSVDLAAPGVSIWSTWPNNQYRSESGTSMASPHVAGAAALVLSAHPTATPATIKALLLRSVDHPAGMAGSSVSSGRLDVGNALTCSATPQVSIDAPSQGFVAASGHPQSVRVLAGLCGAVAGVTVSASANGRPVALTARGDGVYTGQFTPSAPGTTTVTAVATAGSKTDTASVSGTSPSPIVVGGAPVTVTSQAGEDVQLAFDGTAGTRLSAVMSSVTIPSSTVTIRNPDGSTAASQTMGTGSAFLDTTTLAQTGSYVVNVHPLGGVGGTSTIQLFNVPADVSAAISQGGPTVTLTTVVPGQNAIATFTGSAGERVALGISTPIGVLRASMIAPDGTVVGGPLYMSAGNSFIDTVRLPTTGSYTILADPQDDRTGAVTLTLYEVPADVTGSVQLGGPPSSLTTTAPGQNAVFTFAGQAGHRISLNVTSDMYLMKTTILNPDGTTLGSPSYGGAGTSFIDVRTLSQTGIYTVVADPQDTGTGTATVAVYDVPPDPSAAATIGGPPVTLTTTVPGQNASATFAATAGSQVSVTYGTSGIGPVSVTLVAPNGSAVGYGSSGFIEPVTLAQTGTYRVVVDPLGAATGSATVQVVGVLGDVTGSLTVGGAPLTISMAAGQNARVTFTGNAGARVSMSVAGNSLPQTRIDLKAPDGSTFTTFYVASNGGPGHPDAAQTGHVHDDDRSLRRLGGDHDADRLRGARRRDRGGADRRHHGIAHGRGARAERPGHVRRRRRAPRQLPIHDVDVGADHGQEPGRLDADVADRTGKYLRGRRTAGGDRHLHDRDRPARHVDGDGQRQRLRRAAGCRRDSDPGRARRGARDDGSRPGRARLGRSRRRPGPDGVVERGDRADHAPVGAGAGRLDRALTAVGAGVGNVHGHGAVDRDVHDRARPVRQLHR